MAKRREPRTDAVDILHRRYFEGKPEMLELLEQARLNADVAQKVYDLRTQAGLTQRELAERVGTYASVICRLENADYTGHSLTMLQRIAAVLDSRVEVHFVSKTPRAGMSAARDTPVSSTITPRKDVRRSRS